jgi:peroxiredoxin
MVKRLGACAVAIALAAPAASRGQANEASIKKQLGALSFYGMSAGMMGDGAGVPKAVADAERPGTIVQLSGDIGALPPGVKKVEYADQLAVISTQGQNGAEAMQAAADTLAAALKESPQPAGKGGQPAYPYMELAKMARYAGIKTSLSGPMLDKAAQTVAAEEADAQKADFTLKDLDNKTVMLSALKGKIVLVSFFTIGCSACLREMQNLELIHERYADQGLVILSIAEQQNPAQVFRAMSRMNYKPQVLLDDSGLGYSGSAAKAFRIDGVPRTFVFDRDGKLVAQSLDMCSQRQFFNMLGRAGLQPEQR